MKRPKIKLTINEEKQIKATISKLRGELQTAKERINKDADEKISLLERNNLQRIKPFQDEFNKKKVEIEKAISLKKKELEKLQEKAISEIQAEKHKSVGALMASYQSDKQMINQVTCDQLSELEKRYNDLIAIEQRKLDGFKENRPAAPSSAPAVPSVQTVSGGGGDVQPPGGA